MNAKVMAQKGFVEDIANSIGAESEAGKASNVSKSVFSQEGVSVNNYKIIKNIFLRFTT